MAVRQLVRFLCDFSSCDCLLQDIAESITGTVAMINIKLDGHQNKLLGVNVMCSGIAAINCERRTGRSN